MRFIYLFYNSRVQGVAYLAKMNTLTKYHGAGPNAAASA